VTGAVSSAASKAKVPALAIGAAAAGVAGGVLLKERVGRKRVLGVKIPRSVSSPNVSALDLKSVLKGVGRASKSFGQTSKSISRDMERIGDQAERFGNVLD